MEYCYSTYHLHSNPGAEDFDLALSPDHRRFIPDIWFPQPVTYPPDDLSASVPRQVPAHFGISVPDHHHHYHHHQHHHLPHHQHAMSDSPIEHASASSFSDTRFAGLHASIPTEWTMQPPQQALLSPAESLMTASDDSYQFPTVPPARQDFLETSPWSHTLPLSPSPSQASGVGRPTRDISDWNTLNSCGAGIQVASQGVQYEQTLDAFGSGSSSPTLDATNGSVRFRNSTHIPRSTTEEEGEIYSSFTPGPESSTTLISDSESDTDYNPSQSRNRTRSIGRRTRSARSSGEKSNRVSRNRNGVRTSSGGARSRPSFGAGSDRSLVDGGGQARPFCCPLAPYGCSTVFATKNEWKRHVVVQHLKLEFFRCDLCDDVSSRPNDFNRKDLFTQHLRRMHVKKNGRKPVAVKETEKELDHIRERCKIRQRNPPTHFFCVFCEDPEIRTGTFDEWLEHLGKHLAPLTEEESSQVPWARDHIFRDWLISANLLARGSAPGTWIIRGMNAAVGSARIIEEEDAEGEPDE